MLALAVALTANTAACGLLGLGDGDGGTDTDTGEEVAEFCVGGCNGVYVACANPGDIPQSDGGAADGGSGGAQGGGGAPPDNWYWTSCPPTTFTEQGCTESDQHCCDSDFSKCFCKTYDNSDAQSIGDVCVGSGHPPDLDPIDDWDSGTYPGFHAQIQPMCETKCRELSRAGVGFPLPACDAANWDGSFTVNDWDPSKPLNCRVVEDLNQSDPYGIGVPWAAVGGGSSALPLSCDLRSTCADLFDSDIAPYVVSPTEAAAIEPETRGARHLSGSDSTRNPEFFVSVDYDGTRYDETNPIFGQAEYSHSRCSDDACPFYLANLSAYNATDEWTVPVKLDNGSVVTRTFTDLEINLLQSTLGVENRPLGKVAFAPGSLQLGVDFTVLGNEYGSGRHSMIVENDAFVFADVTEDGLELAPSFGLQSLGTATLRLPLATSEGPPTAVHDIVATTASCSFDLSAASMQSTDQDGDIVDEYWVVDGLACGRTCELDPGTHSISLVAIDTRGAVDRTDAHIITVSEC